MKQDKIDKLQEEKQLNIIIKGLPETENERMFTVIPQLLSAMGATFPYSATHADKVYVSLGTADRTLGTVR